MFRCNIFHQIRQFHPFSVDRSSDYRPAVYRPVVYRPVVYRPTVYRSSVYHISIYRSSIGVHVRPYSPT